MKKLAIGLLAASIMINTTNVLSANAASPAGLKGRDAPLSTHDRPRYTRDQRREFDTFNIRESNIDGEDIDILIKSLTPNSPLYGNGFFIKEVSDAMGINPLIYIAMSKIETNLGAVSNYKYRNNLLLTTDVDNSIKQYKTLKDGIVDNIETISNIIYDNDMYDYWSFVKKWNPNYIDKDVYNTILGQITEFTSRMDNQPTIKFKPGFIQEIPDGLINDRISGSYNIDIPDAMLERFIIEAPDFDDNTYNNDFGRKDLLENSDILDQKTDKEKIPKRGSLPGNSHDALLSKPSNKQYNDLNSLISDSVNYNNLIVGDEYKIEVIYTASFWEPIDSESKLSDGIETKFENGKLYKLVKINFGEDGIVYSDYFTPQKKDGNYELTYVINPDFLDRIMEIAEKYDAENIQSDIYILKTK